MTSLSVHDRGCSNRNTKSGCGKKSDIVFSKLLIQKLHNLENRDVSAAKGVFICYQECTENLD